MQVRLPLPWAVGFGNGRIMTEVHCHYINRPPRDKEKQTFYLFTQ